LRTPYLQGFQEFSAPPRQELRTIVDVLYPLQLEASHWISAKPAAPDELEAGITQLYRNIKEEGIWL
jgi:hypothetical protein